MSRRLSRLVLVAAMVAGFVVVPMLGANASCCVDVYDPGNGGFNSGAADHHTDVNVGDAVRWDIHEGKHNITPAEDVPGGQKWGQKGSDDVSADDQNPSFTSKPFTKAGKYYYFSSVGGEGADDHGDLHGMWGWINVIDPSAVTAPPTTAPPTTTTTQAPSTTTPPPPGPTATTATTAPAPAGTAGVHGTPAPPATTTTAKPDKKGKDDPSTSSSSSSTSTTPPPAPVDIPAEAIVPNLTPDGSTVTSTADGVVTGPEGDALAAPAPEKAHHNKGMKLLIASGLGIAALAAGAAGWKFANRSSKYFPA